MALVGYESTWETFNFKLLLFRINNNIYERYCGDRFFFQYKLDGRFNFVMTFGLVSRVFINSMLFVYRTYWKF